MITIIKDPDNVYDENVDIVVNDKNTFIKSRLLIDDLKEGLKENVRIVIIRPSYYKFYEDLGEVEGWINVIEYSFEKAIENYKTDLDKVYIQKIEKFIDDKREVIRFFRDYDNNFSLDENLVIFIFDYGRQLLEIKNYNDLLRWLKNIINKGKTYWLDKRYKDLIIDNLKINLDIKIFDELFSISTISDIEKLQTSLVASYLFSKYPVSSKNLVNTRISLIDDIDVSEELVEGLIKTYPNIISHINITISSIKNKLSIFEEGDIDAFLDRTKGYLDEEWEWVWKHIRENFSINMNKELSKIALWLNNDRHRGKIEILIELLKFLQLKKACSVPVDINGWFEYYQNFYLKWFPNMNYKKNILKRLEELNECFVLSFIQEIKNYKNQMERKYQDFLFKNYPALLRDDYTNLKVIKQIQNYIVENKIFFFVIDGLKFELWNSIKSAFEKYEYFVENAQQECISVLPSITSISRTALITGRSYKTLLDEKKEEEFSFYISNEEKHLKRDFPSYSIVYARGGLSAIDRLLEHEAGIYTLIFSQADAIFHAADAISIEAMEPFLDNLINKLIENINKYGDMIIVLATDHGSTLLKMLKNRNEPSGNNYC